SVDHIASNNYQAGPGAASHYDNDFLCVRQDIRWRPGRHYNSEPCPDPGIQSAIVVGPSGSDIYTDGYGRVKVQFHWDRVGKYDEQSSPWIRVMTPAAGHQFGTIRLPRVKEEVVIQFLDGNIDHPIITGAVYNQDHMPPWKLPEQKALAGARSRELAAGAGRSNHLVLDDTNGKIQAQLRSDHQHSQVSLGHVSRIEDTTGRKDERGEGWELATNAWGVARAHRGMLLTTEARPNAASHIKSMDETVQRLAAAHDQHKAQADVALDHGAQESGQQAAVADIVKAQNDAIKGAGGADGGFPELSAPHLVLASPAGIETTTAQSTHIASAEHTVLTSGRNLSITTGDSLLASISHTFRLFVHKAGMKLIAAAGKVTIRAKTDDIEAIANKVLSLISESDWVDVRGKKGVRLHGAASMVEISDKVQFFTSAPTLFHGNLETLAPKNRPQPAPGQPEAAKPEQLHHTLQAHGMGGGQYSNVPYTLYKGDAKIEDSVTDEFGRIAITHENGTPLYRVILGNGEEFALHVSPRFADAGDSHNDQKLSNQGLRALDDTANGRWYH
ncbi:MAG: type VI secretion system tip protein TssI/VgrG, partial [Telluria sp.]